MNIFDVIKNVFIGLGIIAGCIIAIRIYSEWLKFSHSRTIDKERQLEIQLEAQKLHVAASQEEYETVRNRFLSTYGPNGGSKPGSPP